MHKLVNQIYSFLDTKYNWSLSVLTFVIYCILCSPYSSNSNYDMPKDIFHYFIFANIGILVACIIRGGKDAHLVQCSVLSLILQIVSIMSIKSLAVPGIFSVILVPASIFAFLYLLKETADSVR